SQSGKAEFCITRFRNPAALARGNVQAEDRDQHRPCSIQRRGAGGHGPVGRTSADVFRVHHPSSPYRSWKVRALAVADETRLAQLPSVPTTIESGFPSLQSSYWSSVLA